MTNRRKGSEIEKCCVVANTHTKIDFDQEKLLERTAIEEKRQIKKKKTTNKTTIIM